jgi:hypothetical protein
MGSQPVQHAGPGNGASVPDEASVRLRFRSGAQGCGHTSVPNAVLSDLRLDLVARFTYAVLLQQVSTDRSAPLSIGELARILGIGTRQSSAALQALVQAGLIGVERDAEDQSVIYCLEPLENRYGPGGNGRQESPRPESTRGALPRRSGPADRPGSNETRGAVMPVMTDRRRAFEERLAASMPVSAPERTIDPVLRELGLTRARLLREQLKRSPSNP